MNLSIQKATPADLSALLHLLEETAENLHQKGIRQWESPWEPEEIRAEIDKGWVWTAWDADLLAGTFSLRPLVSVAWLPNNSKPDGQWYLYRVALHPSWQGKGKGNTMVRFACGLARTAGKDLYLDCWAGNETLRRFYASTGFDTIGIFPEENYKISVFVHRYNADLQL